MKIFSEGNVSTPILRKVKTAEDVGKWDRNGNLNGTIKNMFEDKVCFNFPIDFLCNINSPVVFHWIQWLIFNFQIKKTS
jgi:esterase/lipase superfamily enzyme